MNPKTVWLLLSGKNEGQNWMDRKIKNREKHSLKLCQPPISSLQQSYGKWGRRNKRVKNKDWACKTKQACWNKQTLSYLVEFAWCNIYTWAINTQKALLFCQRAKNTLQAKSKPFLSNLRLPCKVEFSLMQTWFVFVNLKNKLPESCCWVSAKPQTLHHLSLPLSTSGSAGKLCIHNDVTPRIFLSPHLFSGFPIHPSRLLCVSFA